MTATKVRASPIAGRLKTMNEWNEFVRTRLARLGLPPEDEEAMIREIALHLESIYEDAIADGCSADQARDRASSLITDWGLLECEIARAKHPARLLSGGRADPNTRIDPDSRGHRRSMINSTWQDLRFAIRMLRKSKALSTVAVLSLALGIGANTAVFSLVDAVLLRMLPVRNPRELVLFGWTSGPKEIWRSLDGNLSIDGKTGDRTSTSFPEMAFSRFHDEASTLADVFAFAEIEQLNVNVDGRAEIATGQVVTGDYFTGLGVSAEIGRSLATGDDREDASPVAVISHRYWQRRFGLDPAAVGKQIEINGVPFTIAGVTPRGFEGAMDVGNSPDFSISLAMEPRISPAGGSRLHVAGTWWLLIMGRLKPGASAEQTRSLLEPIFEQSATEDRRYSKPNDGDEAKGQPDIPSLRAFDGSQGLTAARNAYASPLSILLAVVGLVLLIACANVANLLLARATVRQKEVAVRLALGASRWRLIRQFLTESIVLSVAGGALGLIFAWWGKGLLLSLRPWGGEPLDVELDLDLRVLGFTLAVSILTGIVFGIAPAVRATRLDLSLVLKDTSRGVVGRSRLGLTKALVVIQVALSLLLLVGAGLFVGTLRNLHRVQLGFNPDHLLLFRVDPRLSGYHTGQIVQLYDRMVERIQAVPGVTNVTISRHPLLSGSAALDKMFADGHPPPGPHDYAYIQKVQSNFLQTMGIPILRGRDLTAQDDQRSPRVAVINEALARRYFKDEDPIGKTFGFSGAQHSREIEIVGVSRDAKYSDLRSERTATVYIPFRQQPASLGQMNFEVRTAGEPSSLVGAIREAVSQVDRNVPLFDVKTQKQQADESLAQERLFATLSGFFGLVALLLACLGLYGVMSYAVARRINEIGIRMALGAAGWDVTRMVLRETMFLVIAGIGIGLGTAVGATRWLASMLFGLEPTDLPTMAFAVILMLAVAGLAGFLPARRASRVDPMVALRYE
jgi:predicted permease